MEIKAEKKDAGNFFAALLDLLWLIAVVLLIVYIVGLLTNGYGIGLALHIIAVVALVVLVIWLIDLV